MGFLLGAFGKQAAGSRYRSLQAQMMRIQSKLRRASNQTARMQHTLEQQKKADLNALTYGKMIAEAGIEKFIDLNYSDVKNLFAGMGTDTSTLTPEMKERYGEYQQTMSSMKSMTEMQTAQAKQQIEDKYDMLNDIMLEPLKMEEEYLQSEKDLLETQVQIAKADYDACKEMEKEGAKEMKPNYTAGG